MQAHAPSNGPTGNLETHAVTSHNSIRVTREPSPAYIHACDARAKLLARLDDEEAEDLADPLRKCGQEEELTCGCCGERWSIKKRCHRKWCPVCQRALAARASLRYTGICESMAHPIFATWTVKNWQDLDVNVVRHMRRAFGKLRRLSWWARCVKGGVAGLEVTNIGNGWHPHMHTVIDCRWLAVTVPRPRYGCSDAEFQNGCKRALKEVNEQWSLCTGLKSGLKIKRARASSQGKDDSISKEVLKYSVKGSDLVKVEEPIAEILRMLDSTRLITSFGSCYGHLSEHDLPKVPTACAKCGTTGAWMTEGSVRALLGESKKRRQRR